MSAELEHEPDFACDGKSRIEGVVRARAIAKRMHRRFGEAYHCYFCRGCGYYHVGHVDILRRRATAHERAS